MEHKIGQVERYKGGPMKVLDPDPFLKGYFDSLIPYFAHPEQLKSSLAEVKTREAIELLLRRSFTKGFPVRF